MIASQGTEWLTADGVGYFLGWETYRKNKILRWALKEGIKKILDSLRQTTDTCFHSSDLQPTVPFFKTTLDDCLLLVFVPTLFLPSEISQILQCRDHRLSEAIGPISQSFFSLLHSQKWFPSIVITTSSFFLKLLKRISLYVFLF